MLGDEHDTAFTVAKMMDTDLLKTVQDKLTDALASGSTLADFKRDLIPTLQKAGWWGKKDVLDPLTGDIVSAQLGSASRLETIFRSNIQSAYSVGHWDKISQSARTAPFLMYDAVDDFRTRPEHAARDGQVHPVNSVFWQTHFPPNGWNCRCGVIQLDQDDLDDMGLKPEPSPDIKTHQWKNPRTGEILSVPDDVDPGWDHNPGKARKSHLAQLADDKAATLLGDQRKAMKAALAQQAIKQATYAKQLAKDKAVKALDDHVAANSPYIANEIKKLKAANPGMDPETLLAKAQDKAIKSEQNSLVQAWKQAKKKGKEPGVNAQAYINSLPDEVQAALNKDVEKFTGAAKSKEALAGYMNDLQHPDYEARKAALIKYSPGLGDNPNKLLELVNQEIVAVKVATTNAAMTELALIQDGLAAKQPGLKKKILDKMGAQAAIDATQDPAKLLKKIEEEANLQQAAAEKSSVLSGYKKKVLEGKIPTPKQQQVFNSLDDIEKNKVLADLDAKKGKAAPEPVLINSTSNDAAKINTVPEVQAAIAAPVTPAPGATPINTKTLTQTAGQGGSNPGGEFLDTETGVKWYIKAPKSLDNGRNELLAAKMYEKAGIEIPEVQLIKGNGLKIGSATPEGDMFVASKIIPDLVEDKALLTSGKDVPGVADGFMMDAWLANHDVVGMGFDNLKIKGGRAIHVDTGGALRYRAQGGKKANFGNKVLELESLRDGSAAQTTAVFKNLSQEQLEASARRVLAFTDQDIDDLLDQYGPLDAKDRKKLAATLKARRDYIGDAFPNAKAQPKPAPLPAKARVTRTEQENITNSRSNGYTIATDKDQIEDQNVLLWNKKTEHGPTTNAYLKIRGDAEEALRSELPVGAKARQAYTLDVTKSKYNEMATGIGAQAKKGEVFRDKDIMRIKAAIGQIDQDIDALTTGAQRGIYKQADVDKALTGLRTLREEAAWMESKAVVGHPAIAWRKFVDPAKVASDVQEIIKGVAAQTPGRAWTLSETSYKLSDFEKGHATETNGTYNISSKVFETEIDGAKVRYWPDQDGVQFALRGRLEIEVPGQGAASSAQTFDILEKLGINAARATEKDIELLYLRQIAYANKLDTNATLKKLLKSEDVPKTKAWLSDQLGTDLTKNPHYKPEGERQAFEHGRRTRYRPELLTNPQWPVFERDYRLIHSITNGTMEDALRDILNAGGQMAPTTDKIRRGIKLGGMSPTRDLETGGANYFFTRIQKTNKAYGGEQIVWKARAAARMDAIAYDGDKYGRTTGNHVKKNRKSTIKEMRQAAANSSNETIIKDSLSLFDDLDRIVVGEAGRRDAIIKMFKDAGYDKCPDGRALTDVIKLRNS